MNTCYCLRLPEPHSRTPQCDSFRIDRMIQRRDFERQIDDWLDDDPDYPRQDEEARNVGRKV